MTLQKSTPHGLVASDIYHITLLHHQHFDSYPAQSPCRCPSSQKLCRAPIRACPTETIETSETAAAVTAQSPVATATTIMTPATSAATSTTTTQSTAVTAVPPPRGRPSLPRSGTGCPTTTIIIALLRPGIGHRRRRQGAAADQEEADKTRERKCAAAGPTPTGKMPRTATRTMTRKRGTTSPWTTIPTRTYPFKEGLRLGGRRRRTKTHRKRRLGLVGKTSTTALLRDDQPRPIGIVPPRRVKATSITTTTEEAAGPVANPPLPAPRRETHHGIVARSRLSYLSRRRTGILFPRRHRADRKAGGDGTLALLLPVAEVAAAADGSHPAILHPQRTIATTTQPEQNHDEEVEAEIIKRHPERAPRPTPHQPKPTLPPPKNEQEVAPPPPNTKLPQTWTTRGTRPSKSVSPRAWT